MHNDNGTTKACSPGRTRRCMGECGLQKREGDTHATSWWPRQRPDLCNIRNPPPGSLHKSITRQHGLEKNRSEGFAGFKGISRARATVASHFASCPGRHPEWSKTYRWASEKKCRPHQWQGPAWRQQLRAEYQQRAQWGVLEGSWTAGVVVRRGGSTLAGWRDCLPNKGGNGRAPAGCCSGDGGVLPTAHGGLSEARQCAGKG
jgi:hypothetical protein